MNREEKGVEYKHSGYNCCQAVLLAYEDLTGLSHEELIKIGAPFGSGMGNMRGNCGALVGAQMVLGLTKYEGKRMALQARDVYNKFHDMCKATVCEDIKGVYTGVVLCSCDDCVRNAVKIVGELIDNA